ncbi:MAG: ATP-binding cassette domain-containing protein [Phycisphaerae bacterium]|nr:ATP-binding cassette domain-containing protein [Phycisphaerae bacterium]
MAIVSLQDVLLGFGDPPLLEHVNLQIERGERICLVGRNGAGKSTLLRLISGEQPADAGQIVRDPSMRIARLAQQVPADLAGTVYDEIAAGLGDWGDLILRYHHISHALSENHTPALMAELERIQHELELRGGWAIHQQVETVLSRMGLDGEAKCPLLSAGLKRRVLLARSIVSDPDLLLLDEPTNHLDIDSIIWLEQFLLDHVRSLVFVTHDRALVRRLATRIVDVDCGAVSNWECDYETYVARKDALLEAQSAEQAEFDKKLVREEAWIRRGIKARRTRNEGRVRALEAMRLARSRRRERAGAVQINVQDTERSGQLVIEAANLSFAYGDRPIVRDLGMLIMRGDKIGLIGPNGVGKTTLLRLLLGELAPQAGTLRHGTNLQVAYFDQLHVQLDDSKSIIDNVADGQRLLSINGRPRHVLGYLEDFLFAPDRSRGPIANLSGGERNRLLLAKLFVRPSNVLVLDEPTNDLDAETLELLEELLIDYEGTVLLVSHDREFLNNVVTSTLAFEGDGRVVEYVGGYDDWLRQRPAAVEPAVRATSGSSRVQPAAPAAPLPKRKLTIPERAELEKLPARIDELERRQRQMHAAMSDGAFYKQDPAAITRATAELAEVERMLAELLARWEELESRSAR